MYMYTIYFVVTVNRYMYFGCGLTIYFPIVHMDDGIILYLYVNIHVYTCIFSIV